MKGFVKHDARTNNFPEDTPDGLLIVTLDGILNKPECGSTVFLKSIQPNFECLILHCLRYVAQYVSHIYKRLNKLSKIVGLIDIGVTMATK